MLKKLKTHIKSISWPSFKSIVSDTTFTLTVAVVISVLIMGWTSCIERFVGFIMSLF